MVQTRNRKCCNSSPAPSPTPAKKRKSPRKRYGPFGPYSAADHRLDGLTRKEATKLNDEHLSNAIHELASKPQETRHKLQYNHKMTKPRLHVGRGINRSDAGRWFQWCLDCKSNYWATETRFKQSILFESDVLGPLFHIREELDAEDNGYSTAPCPRPAPQPFPSLSPLHNSPTPPPIPSTSQVTLDRRHSRDLDANTQTTIDKSLAVTLMAWTNNTAPVTETIIYPREDARVRLSDFKVLLGSIGLEQTHNIEVFHFGQARWLPATWTTPHLVPSRGHVLLLQYAGVTHLDGFDQCLLWLSETLTHLIATPPATIDRKGKRRGA